MRPEQIQEKVKVTKDILKDISDVVKDDKKRFNDTMSKEDLVSGDIKKKHAIKWMKIMYREKNYLPLFCTMGIPLLIVVCMTLGTLFDYLKSEMNLISKLSGIIQTFALGILAAVMVVCIVCWIENLLLNGIGQSIIRSLMSAKKIRRTEDVELLEKPIRMIIDEARDSGLALPEDIDVCVFKCSVPLVYAVGMNTLIVSTAMTDAEAGIFKAKVLLELYRINHMDPDYLLFGFIIGLLFLIPSMGIALFCYVEMHFGDRRKNWADQSDTMLAAGTLFGTLIIAPIFIMSGTFIGYKARMKNLLEADQYTVRCGYGTELCTYLDMVGVEDIPYPYRFLEIKKISNDERIAILQKSGVEYFNSDKQ